jgi:DNA topoisomerase VI subunit B
MEPELQQNEFITNISGKIRNTKLPKNKALWPLYEVISNGIHAIEEKGNLKSGQIQIRVIRNGSQETLQGMENVEIYPVYAFIVNDNGIGFNEENYNSFLTAESEYKIEKGAKGIGRFVCLKAFRTIKIESIYNVREDEKKFRSFELRPNGKGIFDYLISDSNANATGTTVTLNNFIEEYQQHAPRSLHDLGERIIEHFLVYFVLKNAPTLH